MSTIDRTAIARRQLETLRDPDQRIEAMLLGGLADEFVVFLSVLTRQECCTLTLEGGCHHAFHTREPRGRHLVLSIQARRDTTKSYQICFDGLVVSHEDKHLMAEILAQLISTIRKEVGDDALTEAHAIAVRRYYPTWDKRGEIEFAALKHHLMHDVELPSPEFLFPDFKQPHKERRAVERQLHDFVSYLKSLGVKQSEIEREAIFILNRFNDNLRSLQKLCAIVGLVPDPRNHETLRTIITRSTTYILRMHFATEDSVVRTSQLDYLMQFSDTFKDERTFINDEGVHNVMVEVLAQGKIQTLLQFLNEIAPTKATNDRRSMSKNVDRIHGMLADAFRLAMRQKRYGVAAALSQLNQVVIIEANADRAIELALLHRQPIALEWAHHLVT